MNKISVIVPVYNVEKYLERCVHSIISQTYSDLEIILVDDGAQDKSPQICDQLAEKDDRIKVIHQKNQGLGHARNAGLWNATGEYVTFIDSDDYIGQTHIEKLHYALLQTNSDIAVGFYVSVDENGKLAKKKNNLKYGKYEHERVFNELLLPLIGTDEKCPYDTAVEPSCCMSMYRLSLIKEHDVCFLSTKEIVGEDQFFNIDCFMHAEKIVVTDVDDYYYYVNSQSMTRKYDEKRFVRTVNYYHLLMQRVNQYGIADQAQKRVVRSFLMKTRIALRLIVFSDLDFRSKRAEIKRILNHEIMKRVIREYPINAYPLAMRVLSHCMKRKSVLGVYFLIKARDNARETGHLSRILSVMGIKE